MTQITQEVGSGQADVITKFQEYTVAPELDDLDDLRGGLVQLTVDPRGLKTRTHYYDESDEDHLINLVKDVTAGMGPGEELSGTAGGIVINASKTSYQYDTQRNMSVSIQHMDSPDVDRQTNYTYDKLNRLVQVKLPEASHIDDGGGTKTARPRTKYEYDGVHLLVKQTDPLDRITEYAYDGMNRLEKTTLPAASYVTEAGGTTSATTMLQFGHGKKRTGVFRERLAPVDQQFGNSRLAKATSTPSPRDACRPSPPRAAPPARILSNAT